MANRPLQLSLLDAWELPAASGWTQRWGERRHSWRHVSDGGFQSRRYDVAELGESEARAYVLRHHYSGSYPAAIRRYGLFEGADLVGVAVLSVPVSADVLRGVFPDLAPYVESAELGRFVLADRVPANGETWFLARAFELAAATGIRGVVSFSDPCPRRTMDDRLVFPGHVGTIYQASNAAYCGRGTPRSLLLLPDGTTLNGRAIQKVRSGERGTDYVERLLRDWGASPRRRDEEGAAWLARALAEVGVRRLRHRGNHKYAFVLGTRRERRAVRIVQPPQPYPKALDSAA